MSQQKEILASISLDGPNFRANYRGLLGYWCQADAVFIETVQPEAGEAIAKYRQKLVAGDIGVSHNQHTDSLIRLALLSQLAAAEAQATELLARATRAEAKAAGLLTELGEVEKQKLDEILAIREAHVSERNVAPLYEAARVMKQCRRPDLAKVIMFEMSCHSSALHQLRRMTPPAAEPDTITPFNL